MRRLSWFFAALAIGFVASGCGGGGGGGHDAQPPPPHVADILSDTSVDGDIDSNGTVTVASGTLLAGVDPVTGIEFRSFLSFPLTSVPANANVQRAVLELFVLDLAPLVATPFTFDLVSFTPPLLPSDFSETALPPILSQNFYVLSQDPGNLVRLDVTPLVREAFLRQFVDGQFRVLLDVNLNTGLVTFADPISSTATAPLLHIEYF